jgi:hypothetical protein
MNGRPVAPSNPPYTAATLLPPRPAGVIPLTFQSANEIFYPCVPAKSIKLLPQRSIYPNAGLRKSVKKSKLKFDALPSLKTARFCQFPRAAKKSFLLFAPLYP